MDIPPYKIHHVLKIFTRRIIELKQAENGEKSRASVSGQTSDLQPEGENEGPISKASGGRRQAVIDRISEQIIHKADKLASGSLKIKEPSESWSKERSASSANTEFTYYVLDRRHRKTLHTLTPTQDETFFQDSEEIEAL